MACLFIKKPIDIFILNLIAIIFILDGSSFHVCDARSPFQKFKLRNGLKLSYYTTQEDAMDLPTLDAYDFAPPSPLSNEPISSPNPSPYGTSWTSGPPSPNPYGISSNSNPPNPSPTPTPYSWISNQPRPRLSPYGRSWISDPPAPTHSDPVAVRPHNGPTQPIHSPSSMGPTIGPSHGWAPDYAVWCIAKPTVPEPVLQRAMDYACGTGADCGPVKTNGPCFVPNTLVAHASYAFNSYWQRTKIVGGTCDFGGAAMLVTVDPSYRGCHFNYT